MGRYVPPEHEGTLSFNQASGKNALGSRDRKSNIGILTVRFEMPFPIWCTTCPKPTIIGQGVRFNAEKKKVGNYFSTPIFSFRMKHVVCGGAIEIRTDPKNTAYVVTEGAKKRDTGEDRVREGEIRIMTDEERDRIRNDAFAALEGKVEDKKQQASEKSRIEALYWAKERDWDDPGEANRRLRRAFRVERKARKNRDGATEALKDKMSLGMDLLEETEEDKRRAGFVEFGERGGEGAVVKAHSRPLFAEKKIAPKSLRKRTKLTKEASAVEMRKEKLRRELENNTRAVLDPFLGASKKSEATQLPLVKRRQDFAGASNDRNNRNDRNDGTRIEESKAPALVDYDSD